MGTPHVFDGATSNRQPGQVNTERTEVMGRRLVLVMAVASGVVVANSYYAQPVVETIARDLHASSARIGLVVTASQLGYAAGLAFVVPLGDLIERRRLLDIVMAATTVSLIMMALAPSWQVLALASLLVGITSVAGQVLVPFASSLAGPEEQGKVIGTVMTGLLLGILLGRVVGGAVAEVAGWRTVFWLAAALMVATAVLLHRELPRELPPVHVRYRALLRSVFRLVAEEPTLRLRMAYGALTFASFGVLWTSIGFLLAGPGYHWSDAHIGLFTLVGVAGVIAAKSAGVLADRGLARAQSGVFIVLIVVSFGLLAMGHHHAIVLGVGVGLSELGIQGTHISNQAIFYPLRPDARSRLNTAYMTAYFAGGAIGSALSALVYASFGWGWVCVVGAAFPTVAAAVWIVEMLTVRNRHATSHVGFPG